MSHNRVSRRRISFVLRLVLGVALLLALLLWRDNGRLLVRVFAEIQWIYVIGLLANTVLTIGVSSMKWRLFVLRPGVSISVWRLMGLYTVGVFFNNFFPSMVGGDLARSYALGRIIGSHARSFVSVLLERLTGIIALATLALLFASVNRALLAEPIIGVSIGLVAIGCAVFLMLLRWPGLISRLFTPLTPYLPVGEVAAKVNVAREEILHFKDDRGRLAKAMAYSYTFHVLTSVNVYLACLAIGLRVSFLDIAVITPIILLITSLPVSLNNLGWWEWAFSIFLVHAGAAQPEGLAVALILRAKAVLTSLIGGVLLVLERMEVEEPAGVTGPAGSNQ